MSKRPMSPRMWDVLRVLAESRRAMTCNEIGYKLDLRGPTAYKGWRGTTKMGPAQAVISPVTALERRGLVLFSARPDGMSGSAYRISEEGRKVLKKRVPASGNRKEVA